MKLHDRIAWVMTLRGLGTPERAVLFVLCAHADDRNDTCWPSLETIAQAVEISQRNVRVALSKLVQKGIIERAKRGFNRSNLYRLTGLNDRMNSSSPDGMNSTSPDRSNSTGHEAEGPDEIILSGEDEIVPSMRTNSSHPCGRIHPPEQSKEQLKQKNTPAECAAKAEKPAAKSKAKAKAKPAPPTDLLGDPLAAETGTTRQPDPVVEALLEVCVWEPVSKADWGRVSKAAKALRDRGRTPEDVREFGRRWTLPKPPQPEQVAREIRQVDGAARRVNGTKPLRELMIRRKGNETYGPPPDQAALEADNEKLERMGI